MPTIMIREKGFISKRLRFRSTKKASRVIAKLRSKGLDVLFFLL